MKKYVEYQYTIVYEPKKDFLELINKMNELIVKNLPISSKTSKTMKYIPRMKIHGTIIGVEVIWIQQQQDETSESRTKMMKSIWKSIEEDGDGGEEVDFSQICKIFKENFPIIIDKWYEKDDMIHVVKDKGSLIFKGDSKNKKLANLRKEMEKNANFYHKFYKKKKDDNEFYMSIGEFVNINDDNKINEILERVKNELLKEKRKILIKIESLEDVKLVKYECSEIGRKIQDGYKCWNLNEIEGKLNNTFIIKENL